MARPPEILLLALLTACTPAGEAGEDTPSEANPDATRPEATRPEATRPDEPRPDEESAVTETHPGAEPYPEPLRERLAAALAEKGEGYLPRTHHLHDDGSPRYTNRLILEDSPYLLQHAHNPVDWYPWGAEAFERARREDKPIFLSIGYSTCHWCHVMERESFESEEIAALMNQHFVCIKVDREQRPDVDELYMTAVQLLTHHGGWPMSSFLTPGGEPFHGGTYYPPQHFVTLLERVSEAWRKDRSRIEKTAGQLTEAVRRITSARGQTRKVGEEVLGRAVEQILGRYDEELGGFGNAPKFPHEPELLFLLDHGLRRGDGEALAVAVHSLDAMARGGIYDQVGGGFHRYSTDPFWLVPHFEKMLYNQAHLGRAYLEAHRLTGEPFFARIARQTLDYVLREMTSPEGGFYSATDADSEGHEGTFFLWTPEELREVLRPADARLAITLWGVRPRGNFEGKSILYLEHSYADFADERKMPLPELLERVDRIREQLWEVREKREHPLRDDKVLTEWNAMMITTFARASEVLGEPRYLEAAERAAELLWRVARRDDGGLWRVHLDGSSSVTGLHGDYAYLTEALLALYDASGEERWLERAREVADAMVERFWDGDGGGFFMTAEDADPHLPGRPKSPSDGAVPSGNSVAVRALALLAARSGEAGYADRAHATVAAFAETLEQQPSAYSYLLLGLDHLLHGGAGPLAYGAGGAMRARAALEPTPDGARLAVELRIRDGWHVNAHRPLQEELIATELSLADGAGGWQLGEVSYPEGEEVSLAFEDDPLRVYTGTVRLTAPIANVPADDGDGTAAPPVLPVALRLQACDDQKCLKPETLRLEVPAAGGSGEAGV